MNRIKNNTYKIIILSCFALLATGAVNAQTTIVRLFGDAEVLMEKGKYKDAIKRYDSIYISQPANPKLFYNRALAYIYLQKYSKALVDLNKSISLDTAYYDAYFNRAFVHSFLNNDAFAIGDYSIYLAKFPRDKEALLARGKLLMEQKEYASAISDLKNYLNYEPKNHEAYASLFFAYKEIGNSSMAHIYLDTALMLKPMQSKYNKLKADMLFDNKKYEEACKYYDRAISSNFGNIDLYLSKAEAKYQLGLYNDAVVAMNRAISYKPNNAELHYDKAFYLLQSKRYTESLTECKKANELKYSDSSSLYFLMAVCSNNLGYAEDACTYFNKSKALGNKDADAYLKQVCEEE